MWDYFPLMAQNLYETDFEDAPGLVERDILSQQFQPLCQARKRTVELQDNEFEYRPPFYIENVCQSPNSDGGEGLINTSNKKCAHAGFSCVQRSETIYLTKRRFSSECWESFTITVPSKCECMWPATSLITRKHHY